MKKYLLIVSLSLFASSTLVAQTVDNAVTKENTNTQMDSLNPWTIELLVGQSKGTHPFNDGYFSSVPEKFFGGFEFNSYDLGVRYMFSPKYGLKLDAGFDKMHNQSSRSLPFEMLQYRVGLQGVVNAKRLFGMEDVSKRWGLLLHVGAQIALRTSKTETPVGALKSEQSGISEWDGGLIYGFSPQYRITNTFAIMADVSLLSNYRQHMNWDGSESDVKNNLSGQMVSLSVGLAVSLGKKDFHGDWAVIADPNKAKADELAKRIGEIENDMTDSDKDGVPDYLDRQPNSIAGVAVDTTGTMIDMNKNNVPDQLETYINSIIQEGNNSTVINNGSTVENNNDVIKNLINDGYKAAYFEFNIDKPTNLSSEGIGFVLYYLRANPNSNVVMTGHADVLGSTKYNLALAKRRAESIKKVLIKSGIKASRIKIASSGIDNSVDKNSKEARRLVRKVTFKVD
jgi:OOP family OmpA-OmpF porin